MDFCDIPTLWANEPNKVYFDKLWAHHGGLKHNYGLWNVLDNESSCTIYRQACDTLASQDKLHLARKISSRFSGVEGTVIYNCIAGLLAYEDCGYLIDCTVDEVKILTKLGDNRAFLLINAVKILNGIDSRTLLFSF